MTAQLGVGKGRKGQVMGDQSEHPLQGSISVGPEDLDEGWWAAVLEDEPLIDDQAKQQDFLREDKLILAEREHSASLVDWEKVELLFKNDEIITLKVVSLNRGGILVEGADVHGFVPASHLIDLPVHASEEEREQYFNSYLDLEIPLKVIECDPEKERVVFSERAALAGAGTRRVLLNSLAEGDVVQGTVTNITDFGVFVDLGGLEGLIHVSELSWGRVHHPSLILKLGDEVKTMVVEVLEDVGRVALSLKRLEKNPWDNLAKQISVGDVLDAVVTSIVKYGAFARLDEGVEGLIHISTIEFPANCNRIDDLLFEGQSVKVGVLNIDAHKRRLGLRIESA